MLDVGKIHKELAYSMPLLFKNLSRIKRFPYESNLKVTHKKMQIRWEYNKISVNKNTEVS